MPDQPFTIVDEVVAPGDPESHYHLVDYQTQELVSTLWSAYLAKAREGLPASSVNPAMRRVSYSLESECQPGQRLKRGIRVASRSRRSCTFEATLSHADDGRVIHSAEMVTVFVDPQRGSVEIPTDFWAAVEQLEGRSIPVVAPSTVTS